MFFYSDSHGVYHPDEGWSSTGGLGIGEVAVVYSNGLWGGGLRKLIIRHEVTHPGSAKHDDTVVGVMNTSVPLIPSLLNFKFSEKSKNDLKGVVR